MALSGAASATKEWFARLPILVKVLIGVVAAGALGAVIYWAGHAAPAPPALQPLPVASSESTTAPSAAATSTASTSTAEASSTTGSTNKTAEQKTKSKSTDSDSSSSSSSSSSNSSKTTTKKEQPTTSLTEATVGLTARQRKAIALAIIAMEKKATEQADAKYPTDPEKGGTPDNFEVNLEYWGQLDEQYKAEIMKEHDITLEQLIFVMIVDVSKYM